MNARLEQLRNAVVGRGREVEVDPSGVVREAQGKDEDRRGGGKPTKLAPRTFGGA